MPFELAPLKSRLEFLLEDASESIKDAPTIISEAGLTGIEQAKAIKSVGANSSKLGSAPDVLRELLL
jgi:hypothetical protein